MTAPVRVHHEHGVGHGDYADVECCICPGTPCDDVTVADMVRHREHDRRASERWGEVRARQEISDAIAKAAPADRPLDPPDAARDAAVDAFLTAWTIARGTIDEPPF